MSALASIVKAHPRIADGFRLGETSSYWHHGSPNVSNTHAAAVWGVDYMLETAQLGCRGVHFHGGGMNMDGNVCTAGPSSCTNPWDYAPIFEDMGRITIIQGPFYAMLVVAQAGTGDLLATTVNASGVNLRAYAIALADGTTEVVLVNKDLSSAARVSVDAGATVSAARASAHHGSAPHRARGRGDAGVAAAGLRRGGGRQARREVRPAERSAAARARRRFSPRGRTRDGTLKRPTGSNRAASHTSTSGDALAEERMARAPRASLGGRDFLFLGHEAGENLAGPYSPPTARSAPVLEAAPFAP